MARIRTVKPEYWSSEQILNLSIPARLLFIGLWNYCDDAGIHPASSITLKAEVFPGDEVNVAPLIEEIEGQGLISQYEVNGKSYWHVTGWHHQKIDRPTFKHPLPDGTAPQTHDDVRRVFDEYSTSPHPRKGRESIGKEEERNKTLSSSGDDGNVLFDEFWRAYPKKVGRDAARKAWDKRKPDSLLSARMVQAIERQKVSDQWKRDDGQYIPHPATWLNQGRWEDEEPEPPQGGTWKTGIFAGGI